jgi:hypothetical protein
LRFAAFLKTLSKSFRKIVRHGSSPFHGQ